MTALPQDAVADLQQRIAELERQLETAVNERDTAIERQTASALVNFRLKNELRAATDRQKASAEILNAIANTEGDAGHALQRIAETTANFFSAAGVTIRIAEGDQWVQTVRVGAGSLATGAQPAADIATGGHNVPGTVYQENRQIHIPDLDNIDPSMAHWPATAARAAGIRTICGTPLRREGKAIGALIVYRDRLAAFTDDELALQQTFADQAVIAIENARLFNETQKALERQSATADILKVIASSPSDVQPVFEAIATSANRLLGGLSTAVFSMIDDVVHLMAFTPVSSEADAALKALFPAALSTLPVGLAFAEAIRTGEILGICDTEVELADQPSVLEMTRLRGWRSVLYVPLLRDKKAIGLINVTRVEAGSFADHHVQLLQTFADQAVIAIENTRLFNETQEALERQTATAEVLKVIAGSPSDVQPVFDAIAERSNRLMGGHSTAVYRFIDEMVELVSFTPVSAEADAVLRAAFPRPLSQYPMFELVREGNTEQISDVESVEAETILSAATPTTRDVARARGFRSVLLTPLPGDRGPVGLISVTRREPSVFASHHVQLLKTFADQAVIAIENARLFNETQEALERQTATADILKVIASSPSDVQPVFEAIVNSAARLFEPCTARITTLRDGMLHWHAANASAALQPDVNLERARSHYPLPFDPDRSPSARAILERRIVEIPDTAAPDTPEFTRRAAAAGGFRSVAFVPLINRDKGIGTIIVTHSEPGFRLSEKQLSLAQTFADQAVIAIENTRLFNEVRARTVELSEALEQQTATAEVLGVISSSPGDLAPVFDAMLGKAMQLCGANFGVLNTYDGQAFHTAATYGLPPAYDDHRRGQPLEYGPGTAPARLLDGEPFVQLTNLLESEAYRNGEPNRRALVDIGGARCLLAVPLVKDERVVGNVMIFRQENRPFSEKQIALLQQFAAQAVIAIENTRLLRELRESTDDLTESLQQQTATSDLLQVISRSAFDLQPIFDAIAERSVTLCGADRAFIFRFDGELLRMATAYNAPPDFREWVAQHPIRPGRHSASARAALERRTIHIHDVRDDPEYTYGAKDAEDIRTVLGVPILKGDELLGVMMIYHLEGVRPFTEKQIALVETFADQAAIAIENVQLFNEVEQRTEDLSESLQQQTAVGDVLKTISRSTFDLQPVLDTLVETAMHLCNAEMSFILRRDGDVYRAGAAVGFATDYIEFLKNNPITPDRGTITGRTVLERRPVHILDVETDPEYTMSESVTLAKQHTALGVPLMRENEPVGVIVLARQRVEAFTQKQIDLVTTFADQAVIAIENVRLFDQLQHRTDDLAESLQQQTATSEVLQVISSSPGDLTPVFDKMLENATKVCGAGFGSMVLVEGDMLRQAAFYNAPAELAAVRTNAIRPLHPLSSIAEAVRDKRVVQTEDIRNSPAYLAGAQHAVELAELGGARTIAVVPMLRDDEAIGVITVYRQEVRPFSDKQIELLTNFARQAVIAIENARLLRELRQRTDDLSESLQFQTATSDVLKVISRSPDTLQPVLDAIVETSRELCGSDGASIFLLRDEKFHLTAVSRTMPGQLLPGHLQHMQSNPVALGQPGSVLSRVVREKRSLHIPNVMDDPELRDGTSGVGGPRALLAAPLMSDGDVVGVIILRQSHLKPFTPRQVQAIETFADQAVIAISNVNLFEQVQARTRDLTESLQFQTATSDVLKVISRSPDTLQPVLDVIVETSRELCGSDASTIFLLRDGKFHVTAISGSLPTHLDHLKANPLPIGQSGSILSRLYDQKRTLNYDNVLDDPELRQGSTGLGGARALLSVPLLSDGDVIGAITLRQPHTRPFAPRQIQAIETFADQAVIAISNVNLFEQVQQRTRELSKSLDDLRTAQDRLIQTEKLASLGQLTAGIAHEIKNPLNFVNNFSALSVELTDELNDILKQAELAEAIRKEIDELTGLLKDNLSKVVQHGKRADSIVKNMLLHSREGTGEHRPADVNALVDESLNLAYHGARAEKPQFNVTLKRDFDPAAGQVEVFPQEITRVLLNLISNGFYAVTKRKAGNGDADFEPQVTATTRGADDHVEIRIRDNGTGIPPEVKEKMFNPFFTTKPAGEGTGLGLSMSHDIIVKQHGGTIEVATEPGAFTEFRLVLPRTSLARANGNR